MFFRNWARLYSNPTPAEQAIEPAIAALGRRYRAQHPFFGLHHIADFALLDDRIVIEVDGRSHKEPAQIRKDIAHTLGLMKIGWRVVRCTNEEAIAHPSVTVSELLNHRIRHLPTQAELEARLALYPAPPPRESKRRARVPKPPRAKTPGKSGRKAKGSPVAE